MRGVNEPQAPLYNNGANGPRPTTPVVKSVAAVIDWLRYTVPYNTALESADNLRVALPRDPAFTLTGEMVANGQGYDSAMKLSHGVIHWHTKRPEQGVSVELGGAALAGARNAGVRELFLLQHIVNVGGHVSTMDGAIDIYNHDASETDIMLLFDAGCLETTAREIGPYRKSRKVGQGWQDSGTVYVGSPKSPRQIKIYNKAAEQHLDGVDWIRVEMRWRGRHARAAHAAMLQYGIAPTIRKAITTMLNADIEWFQEAMNGELATIEPVRRLETDTKRWLMETIAPVLERELMAERAKGESELYSLFNDMLRDEYKARGMKAVSTRNRQ